MINEEVCVTMTAILNHVTNVIVTGNIIACLNVKVNGLSFSKGSLVSHHDERMWDMFTIMQHGN